MRLKKSNRHSNLWSHIYLMMFVSGCKAIFRIFKQNNAENNTHYTHHLGHMERLNHTKNVRHQKVEQKSTTYTRRKLCHWCSSAKPLNLQRTLCRLHATTFTFTTFWTRISTTILNKCTVNWVHLHSFYIFHLYFTARSPCKFKNSSILS